MQGLLTIVVAGAALLITFLLGIPGIPFLQKLKCGQEIRGEGPAWHQKKSGTPTMGGIMMIIGYVFSLGICWAVSQFGHKVLKVSSLNVTIFISGLVLSLGMGAVGFIDDYIKVVKKRNLGLTALQKTFLQMLVSASFLASLGLGGLSSTWLPFIGTIDILSGFGILFWPIALFFVYGFVNAVNLTDGLDGLASSVTLVASIGLMILSARSGQLLNNISACALAGTCVGFLMWNAHPAKVFMGDTGSLFLGGTVVALSFGSGRPVLLLLFGFVYLCEALSVVLQVTVFKLTGKRVFKMSPIHHHFEMCGWSEDKIVLVFSLITLLTSAVAVVPFYL